MSALLLSPLPRRRGDADQIEVHSHSTFTCLHLVTMSADRIGKLSLPLLQKLDDGLKASLELP
ncbi:MAG TPA: hypothetical protein VN688_23085 [Gemmataceae bacterium]|nr:hypothetical protein [Gemmataceae bacterium]